jgi:hypothetical protein
MVIGLWPIQKMLMSSWHRLPRSHVLRNLRNACQPMPGSSNPIFLSRASANVPRCCYAVRGSEQEAILAAHETLQELCNIGMQIDITISCFGLQIRNDAGLLTINLLPNLNGPSSIDELLGFKGKCFSAKRVNQDLTSVLPLTSQKSLAMVRAHLSSLFIAATTLMAGVTLAIVVSHILAN